MESFAEVFERKEVKYVLDARQKSFITDALFDLGGMQPDAYGRGRVSSLYLDTRDRRLVERSLEKPLYKEKLRVRWYGVLSEDAPVFIEVKKKFKGIVYKRRVACTYKAARAYLSGTPYERACKRFPLPDIQQAADSLSERSIQTASEIDQLLQRYHPLHPSMLVTCLRTAYTPAKTAQADAAQSDVRVTFDEDVSYVDLMGASVKTQDLQRLLPADTSIMEVKVPGAFPLWLTHVLAACGAYPSSFSKYGAAYLASISRGQSAHALLGSERDTYGIALGLPEKGTRARTRA